MAGTGPSQVTQLLAQWGRGDRGALDSLVPLVYAELHQIASRHLRRERAGHTLQPTALVHEAWMRLVKQDSASFDNRNQFFALAARVMRQVLVDHARRIAAGKRGGRAARTTLHDCVGYKPDHADDLLALDQALEKLARLNPRKSRVIELRYFGGLNVEEMAEVLGVSIATVSREQKMAEAWLVRAMNGDDRI